MTKISDLLRYLLENTIINGDCHECHMNRGATNGYPKISAVEYAHRFVFERINGPIPEGMYVCHSCDNRKCIHPEHLFLGTPQDNIDDMIRKGRMGKVGGQKPRLFDNSDVIKMLKLRSEGMTQRQIASELRTSQSVIQQYLKEADGGRRRS